MSRLRWPNVKTSGSFYLIDLVLSCWRQLYTYHYIFLCMNKTNNVYPILLSMFVNIFLVIMNFFFFFSNNDYFKQGLIGNCHILYSLNFITLRILYLNVIFELTLYTIYYTGIINTLQYNVIGFYSILPIRVADF